MRKALKKIEGIRSTFTGTFVRFGTKNGYKGIEHTVLLKDIKDSNGCIVTDHLWFNLAKGFKALNLRENDVVQFDARVKEYTKGYFGYKTDVYVPAKTDYKLSHPTKVNKL